MILEDDSTTRDINDYKVQCRWIESFLTPRETKLFITIKLYEGNNKLVYYN